MIELTLYGPEVGHAQHQHVGLALDLDQLLPVHRSPSSARAPPRPRRR